MVRGFYLPGEIYGEICFNALRELPLEACGYLAGKGSRVSKLFRMRNADVSQRRFSFDPEEQLAVMEEAGKAGLELIAVYHSHPQGPPGPSAEDLRMALDPQLIHVIISLLPPEPTVRAFRIEDGEASEIPLVQRE